MKIAIITSLSLKPNIETIKETLGRGQVYQEKQLIGYEEVFQYILEYGPDALELIITIFDLAKSLNQKAVIKIDGVEYEYENEQQLKEIINAHQIDEK